MGVDDDIEDVSEAERREAEALARALEDGVTHPDLPADAWQAAMLLRHAQAPEAPAPDTRVMAELERRKHKRRRIWSWASGAVALAATVLIGIGVTRTTHYEAPAANRADRSAPASPPSPAAAEPVRESDEALLARFVADPASVACPAACAAAERLCATDSTVKKCVDARVKVERCRCPTPH